MWIQPSVIFGESSLERLFLGGVVAFFTVLTITTGGAALIAGLKQSREDERTNLWSMVKSPRALWLMALY
jgi:hypothetical protein